MSQESENSHPSHGRFAATQWSVVLAAADRTSPAAREALQQLCQTYWYPLYAFARRSGQSPDDAADQAQSFFARLLASELLNRADPERGRFRSYLLTAFRRFLINEHERERAVKRGGDLRKLSIDSATGERRYAFEPADDWTPEAIYERRWALTVLEQSLNRLGVEYGERGRSELFEQCRGQLSGVEAQTSYSELATTLGMTETALRVAVHRMRMRYRELLMGEIAATIDEQESVVEELKRLQNALRGRKL